eukprot:gnl/Spiro4/12396_TR6547_c0_g1_i1.p1 gnl/Spiro4/12396_TR6547_c0_g1~~gnl/Spiro4/12396_TR6547_c0_g1_i1.p1  ORF type:complete len:194 (+),score=18.45 gnl/Spiro4/12396_TR6547_c0_g1_i1:59-640(+)
MSESELVVFFSVLLFVGGVCSLRQQMHDQRDSRSGSGSPEPSEEKILLLPWHEFPLDWSTGAFQIGGASISLQLGHGDVAYTVWDGAVVLSQYFNNEKIFPSGFFHGKRVLELGAGTGLCGIALARLGADVTVTDLAHTMAFLDQNVQLNHPYQPPGRISAHPLPWSSGSHTGGGRRAALQGVDGSQDPLSVD